MYATLYVFIRIMHSVRLEEVKRECTFPKTFPRSRLAARPFPGERRDECVRDFSSPLLLLLLSFLPLSVLLWSIFPVVFVGAFVHLSCVLFSVILSLLFVFYSPHRISPSFSPTPPSIFLLLHLLPIISTSPQPLHSSHFSPLLRRPPPSSTRRLPSPIYSPPLPLLPLLTLVVSFLPILSQYPLSFRLPTPVAPPPSLPLSSPKPLCRLSPFPLTFPPP